MPINYNVADWYWSVAGSTTQVWSSQRCQYVAVGDATYAAWLAAGNAPSQIVSAGELFDVLLQQWAPAVQTGVTLTSTATPALNGSYRIDPVASQKIIALSTGIAAGKPLPGGGSTFNYPDAANVMHAFTAADFLNFAAATETYVYQFEQALWSLLNQQSASYPASALTIA